MCYVLRCGVFGLATQHRKTREEKKIWWVSEWSVRVKRFEMEGPWSTFQFIFVRKWCFLIIKSPENLRFRFTFFSFLFLSIKPIRIASIEWFGNQVPITSNSIREQKRCVPKTSMSETNADHSLVKINFCIDFGSIWLSVETIKKNRNALPNTHQSSIITSSVRLQRKQPTWPNANLENLIKCRNYYLASLFVWFLFIRHS